MLRSLLRHVTGPTPQSEPLAGAATPQVPNSAGGFAWALDPWQRLERFLILGADGGTYYAQPRALALESAAAVFTSLDLDGLRTVRAIASVSQSGRAPRNDAAIFALALALKAGDAPTRSAAADAVPAVCRTGTHLFELASAVDAMGGWGRATRRAFAGWYTRPDVAGLVRQGVKYGQRSGWSHRDLLRKSHPVPPTSAHDAAYRWLCTGEVAEGVVDLRLAWAAQRAAQATTPREVVAVIERHGLPREAVPTRFLHDPSVWRALLMAGRGMPMTAMLRNLAKMTAVGLLTPGSVATRAVCARLREARRLRRARVHPLAILVARNTYQRGRGLRGKLTWEPVREVLAALEQAFHLSFDAVEPSGKRVELAVDVSGSMGWGECAGMTGITPRVGAAAMALASLRREREARITAFSHRLIDVELHRHVDLDEALAAFDAIPMGATDCALPMRRALRERRAVDAFVVYTDSETWFGEEHPAAALRRYRDALGIPAKLVVVGMVSNGFTIADPDDAGMLDVVGFDTSAPAVIAGLLRA